MATDLTTTLTLALGTVFTNALDLSTPDDTMPLTLSDALANGTGTDQANAVWHDERTLAGASEDIDLTSLTGPLGAALTFSAIKAILIKNTATTTAFDLLAGGAAANAWEGWVAAAGDIRNVMPNGIDLWWSPTDAETVDGTNKNLKIDSGANAITYQIVIIGTK